MPIATNPGTGETVFLDQDGSWKPAQTAVNPQTKQMMAFDGKDWSEVQPKSKGILSYIDDAVRSVANGVTLGWADELAAKGNELIGHGTYDENVKAERARNEQISPAISVPGEIAGSMMIPLGAAASGATMGARVLRGAGVGGLFGAVSGAGSGTDIPDRAARAAVGAAAGTAVGAIAPPLVEGVIQGGRALAQPLVTAVRGAINPTDEASRRVVTALQRDMRADPPAVNRLTPAEFAGNVQQGGPAVIMDMGGETTRALARSAANTSPEGRQTLNNAINDRFEGQSGRISDWLRGSFNFPDAASQQQAINDAARTVNRSRYNRAFNDPNGHDLWDVGFQDLTAAPAVQDAIRESTRSGANRAAATGARPPVNPFQFAADGTMQMRQGVSPTLQFWDQVKRNLDGQIQKAQRAGDRETVSEVQPLRQALVDRLDQAVPSYQEARAGAAHFFGASDALEAGQNFVMAKMANGDARRALAQMSPTERQLFQDGFVSRYVDTLNATGDRRSVLNTVANSPEAREKLQIALGPQRATELEARLRVEGIMDLARSAVQGNSTTARQLAELGFAGGAGALGTHGTYNMDPKEMTAAAVAGALIAGKHGIDGRVARQVADMLVSQNPQLATRGLNLVARNGRFMDALRTADRRIAGAGAEQAPKIGVAAQLPTVSRADDQPDVPRPPGQ